ncbi:hypothetical protein Pcinc_010874 [Petrolisthes cinctipes]|uniref:Uncharacterized protein n=1 Tax=Petrolisthes cinctipes TaxID=88211 RepID=A0AAE1G444_PETCI|nr:hypothetical protein Pcinc_010874 [Petrolisthes cinctipes]
MTTPQTVCALAATGSPQACALITETSTTILLNTPPCLHTPRNHPCLATSLTSHRCHHASRARAPPQHGVAHDSYRFSCATDTTTPLSPAHHHTPPQHAVAHDSHRFSRATAPLTP